MTVVTTNFKISPFQWPVKNRLGCRLSGSLASFYQGCQYHVRKT